MSRSEGLGEDEICQKDSNLGTWSEIFLGSWRVFQYERGSFVTSADFCNGCGYLMKGADNFMLDSMQEN